MSRIVEPNFPMKLPKSFYEEENVVRLAQSVLGKYLFTSFQGFLTGGIITETEAYEGVTDRASHAYGNRRTSRTEIMYAAGGTAYVYLCYGIHSLFNIVTSKRDTPHAILVRALVPTHGLEVMMKRRNTAMTGKSFSGGPGTVSQALGIHYTHSGISLAGNEIWLEDRGLSPASEEITAGPRIGVEYAGADAGLPYRFIWKVPKKILQVIQAEPC